MAATVDIYDIEVLKFKDANVSGGWDIRYLTDGQVIGTNEWQGDLVGTEVDYDSDNVSFVVDGDTLKVMADVTVTTEKELFDTFIKWTRGTKSYYGHDYPTYDFAGAGFSRSGSCIKGDTFYYRAG